MKRLFLCSLLLVLCSRPASAILDTNNNGLSDVWERIHYNGDLFPSSFDPLGDDDSDGWTNAEEAVAGTDPESPHSPDGMLRPEVVILHDVLLDLDNDSVPEFYAEVATITWPIVAGKFYTLHYSPDMTENSRISLQQAAATSDGTRTANFPITSPGDKMFWRVTVEDIDSDGDGLTDAEEYKLGTNPQNAQTITDISDLWLATHFTNILLAGGPNMIDLNADPDNDGYTNEQEAYLGTNPNTPNTPITGKIGQEAIVNGTFSEPIIGSVPSNTSDSTWDYWGAGGVKGWSAYFGTNIEFQNITPKTAGNPYVELKAHPVGHYGIKQDVGTHKGTTYLLVLDCRDRAAVDPACSNFNVLIDGAIKSKISFTDSTGTVPLTKFVTPGAWFTVAVPFTATKPLTQISLVPVNTLNDTTGCLVDNVRITHVEVVNIDKNPVAELKVAKMIEFGVLNQNRTIIPSNDQDCFYIRVEGGASLGQISVMVSTVDNPDSPYNDGPTQINLHPDGDDAISNAMLLVSDNEDDAWPIEGIADNEPNDQTFKIQLGGSFMTDSVKVGDGPWQVSGKKYPVRVVKTVQVNVVILRNKALAEGGVELVPFTTVAEYLRITKERYAQVGVDIEVVRVAIEDPPPGVDLSDGLTVQTTPSETTISNEARSLIQRWGTVGSADIHIFYVNNIVYDVGLSPMGIAFAHFALAASEEDYTYNAFVSTMKVASSVQLGGLVTAHELGHLLRDAGHAPNTGAIPEIQLMIRGRDMVAADGILSSKRLSNSDETAIQGNSHAK